MTRCIFPTCPGAVDGWFLLAPGCQDAGHWPVSIGYIDEPVPLCDWHAQMVGDQRIQEPVGQR